MSRGNNPLFWMMACTLPSAGHALGLGDIHVDSALNEPLAAEIDIVGATPEDLIGLIATVANRETFAHFNAERPAFLNTATFKITTDAKGKPVLAIRSSESFTEPLIDLVVDLRWRNGQLIRQYSLLLDPAGFPTAPQAAAALPVTPTQAALSAAVITAATAPAYSPEHSSNQPADIATPVVAAEAATSGRSAQVSTRTMTQMKVGAKATLRGVAWRVGARSSGDLNQMMIAIFRANPSAFDGNINRLRLGAMLRIPSVEEVEAIPYAEANRETRAQMKAWRASVKRPGSNPVSAVADAAPATPASAPQVAEKAPLAAAPTPASAAPVSTAPVSSKPAPVSAPVAPVASVAVPAAGTVAAAVPAPAAAPSAKSGDAASEKAVLTTQLVSLEGSLHDLQAQLEAQHNKLLTMQAQQRYAELHPTVVAAPPPTVDHKSRGLLAAALVGVVVLAGACVALLARLRRRAKTSSLPSIEKVPAVSQLDPAPASAAKPKPVVRAPEAARIEVQEHHVTPDEPRVEARIGMHEMRPEAPHDPMESALELSTADTSGINAAKLREELAAAKLREEIAAAWALPAAETYKREDLGQETTLAQDIARSLEDTVALEPTKAHTEDTLEEEAYTDTIANTDVDTIVGEAGETANFAAATALLPPPVAPVQIDADHLDYNFMDLEDNSAAHPKDSTTKEHVVKDRRTNLVDVLKQAIEREPQRRDLRIKLLETYYAEAANNRQSFLEAVQRLAQERGDIDDAEWQKIEQMGRKLGADSPSLSSEQDDDFADCA